MSADQAFSTSEVETLLVSVCKEALTGTLDAGSIWKDKQGFGQKTEPYIRINARNERERHGPFDNQRASAPEDVDGEAVLHTTRSRTLPVFIDAIGQDSYEIARVLSDQLEIPVIRELLWAKGVGLLSSKGPIPIPYNEGQQRKEYHRLILNLHLLETKQTDTNYIKYLEVRSDQLGIPEETIELIGG